MPILFSFLCFIPAWASAQDVMKISPSDIFSGFSSTTPTLSTTPTPVKTPEPTPVRITIESPAPILTKASQPTRSPAPAIIARTSFTTSTVELKSFPTTRTLTMIPTPVARMTYPPKPTPTPPHPIIPSPRQSPAPTKTPPPSPSPQPRPTVATTTMTLQPAKDAGEKVVFDNKSLEEFVITHPVPMVQPGPLMVTATPDIELLRRRLYATPTPTPVAPAHLFQYKLHIKIKGVETRWDEPLTHIDFYYMLRAFYGAITVTSEDVGHESVRFVKNMKSHEQFPLKPGRHQIMGEFWLLRNPEEKIIVTFGAYNFSIQTNYLIELDEEFERALLYELELREIERQKGKGEIRSPVSR